MIYRSQRVCSVGVAGHRGTGVEVADCEMVVVEGGLYEVMLLEKMLGYL